MNKIFSQIIASFRANRSGRGKLNFWQRLVEPVESITLPSERRQVRLISSMLLVIAVFMTSGVVFMRYFSTNPVVGTILAGSQIAFGIAYLLSRTRHYQLASFLSLLVLSLIPLLNVTFSSDPSAGASP